MKQHGHRIEVKKDMKFDNKWADWCTYRNFKTMYTEVYEEAVSGRIVHKLDAPVWLNKRGEIVELEGELSGLKTEYLLHHPSKLMFVDKVGSNTSQAKDGNCRGKKFITPNDIQPQIKAATKTHILPCSASWLPQVSLSCL